MTGQQTRSSGLSGGTRCPGNLRAHVDDGGDLGARLLQHENSFVGAVIVGEERDPSSRQDTVLIGIALGRTCEHHTGPVVARKNQRTLEGAGRQHDSPGADRPVAVTRLAFAGRVLVVANTFERCQRVAVVISPDGCAAEHTNIGEFFQIADCCVHPVGSRHSAYQLARPPGGTSEAWIKFGEDDALSAFGRCLCRHQARGSGTDDEYLAKRIHALVACRVFFKGSAAETRRAADEIFAEPPEAGALERADGWPHEGLVVETG